MIRISDDARFVEEDDGGILLDIRNDQFFDLNATAAAIFRHATAGKSAADITSLLIEGTDLERRYVCQEVNEFLEGLARLGLVTAIDECAHNGCPQ